VGSRRCRGCSALGTVYLPQLRLRCVLSLAFVFLFWFYHRKKSQTFKPRRNIPEGTKQYQLKKYAEATLGSGNLKLAVALPEGEDLNEWLAVNSTFISFLSFYMWHAHNDFVVHKPFLLVANVSSQLWISLTRSICCTAPSLSSVRRKSAL
jgi:hypothetical protein